MKVCGYSDFGPAVDVLTLQELPTPDPAPGEVLVELSVSAVNPSDVKARAGGRPGVTAPPFDLIVPHSDGAGVLVAVGEGVDPARVGQRVWIWNGQWRRAFGTAATHIALPSDQAVALPEGVSFETGASLGIPGLTACHTVFGGGDVSGQTVLVQGGAGTVGYLAVQLAAWGGAKVIATARGAGAERCAQAGACAVIDYSSPDLAAQILAANNGVPVDRIIEVEFGANIETDAEVIAENGTIVAYGSALSMTPTVSFGPLLFKAVTIDIALIYLLQKEPRADAISKLHKALSENALHCPVEDVYPLEHTAQAHEAVERGARSGAILINTAG